MAQRTEKQINTEAKLRENAADLAKLIDGLSRREALIVRKSGKHGFLVSIQRRQNIEIF